MLEERLGLRLIQRSTRHFVITDIGRSYYEHCRAMLVEAEAAQQVIDASRAEPRGIIRMTCPISLLHVHVSRMLANFMAQYPMITVYLEATNRRVDVVGEAVDVAIRVRPAPLEDSDLVIRVLADRNLCLVASPALIESHGLPLSPSELNGWPSLGLGTVLKTYNWSLYGPNNAQAIVHHVPRFVTADMLALRDAALKGLGVVQLPLLMVCDQLANGSLVRVVPEWEARREIIHLVFPSRRGLLPSVRALVDYLAKEFAAIDED
jgi:DNA-binding transcriptional LysR family regulator